MASSYTENFGLCQWEATDQVVRTEFNENNRTIDESLSKLQEAVNHKAEQTALDAVEALATKSRFAKLKEINITSYVTSAELDLSDIDWNQWDKVHVDILTPQAQQGNIDLNSDTENSYIGKFGGEYSEPGIYHPRITFYPNFQVSRFITLTYIGTTKVWLAPYNTVTKLLFTSNSINGIYLAVWGEK